MNNLSNHFLKETKRLQMTAAEKEAMRSQIFAALQEPVRSPYQRFFAPRAFAYAFVALLMLGGGTTYAAQGALPGNPLYAVKINVNEQVEAALATTPAAKLQVNAKLAQRRIAEVQVLAEQGVLDATTTTRLEKDFDEHSAVVAKIAASNPIHENDAEEIATKIDASLDVLGEKEVSLPKAAATMSARTMMVLETAPVATTTIEAADDRHGDTSRKNSERFLKHARAKVQAIRNKKESSSADDSVRIERTTEKDPQTTLPVPPVLLKESVKIED